MINKSPEFLVRCNFGGGGVPKAPPPPVPPPSNVDAAAMARRNANVNKKGRASTILGGADQNAGANDQILKKTLLGG